MGLFSKKTFKCSLCGKEITSRLTMDEFACPECMQKLKVRGYIDYARAMSLNEYPVFSYPKIAEHRNQILEKYRMTSGINMEQLRIVSENCDNLTQEQRTDAVRRIVNSTIQATMGAAFTKSFYVPTAYENTVVDADDVFAVGYISDYKLATTSEDTILCAVFTNDPYIPAFPIVFSAKLGFFEVMKSKKGREGVEATFYSSCKNLTYPVCELKQLKKLVKGDITVKGNIEKKRMLNLISDASTNIGIFNTKKMTEYLEGDTQILLNEYGYLLDDTINQTLGMSSRKNAKFWDNEFRRVLSNS